MEGRLQFEPEPVLREPDLAVEAGRDDAVRHLVLLALRVGVEMRQEQVLDRGVRERAPELRGRRVVRHVDLVGKRTVVREGAGTVREPRHPLEGLRVAGERERPVRSRRRAVRGREPVGEPRLGVACLAGGDREPAGLERSVAAHLPNGQIDPSSQILVHVEQVVEEVLRPGRADDLEVFLTGEPASLQQRQQVRDVVEVVVGEQDGADAFVADVGPREPSKHAAPAVHEQRAVAGLQQDPGLGAAGDGHRAAGTEKRDVHGRTKCGARFIPDDAAATAAPIDSRRLRTCWTGRWWVSLALAATWTRRPQTFETIAVRGRDHGGGAAAPGLRDVARDYSLLSINTKILVIDEQYAIHRHYTNS